MFNGKWIKLPWKRWEHVEISPDGIRTERGFFRPDEIDLLLWKASYYDPGHRPMREEILMGK